MNRSNLFKYGLIVKNLQSINVDVVQNKKIKTVLLFILEHNKSISKMKKVHNPVYIMRVNWNILIFP